MQTNNIIIIIVSHLVINIEISMTYRWPTMTNYDQLFLKHWFYWWLIKIILKTGEFMMSIIEWFYYKAEAGGLNPTKAQEQEFLKNVGDYPNCCFLSCESKIKAFNKVFLWSSGH